MEGGAGEAGVWVFGVREGQESREGRGAQIGTKEHGGERS